MKLLVINTSLDTDTSATRTLVAAYVSRLTDGNADIDVAKRDFVTQPVPHLPPALVPVQLGLAESDATPAAALADTLIEELEAADVIVLGLPMYNFTVPSSFKAWLDHVIRAGRTFTYEGGAPKGLVPAGKRVVAFVASGGVYTSGPAQPLDFVEPYLRAVLGFIGLTDVTVIRAEGQSVSDLREPARRRALGEAAALAA